MRESPPGDQQGFPHLLELQMPAELQVAVDAAASCGGAEGCQHWAEPRGDGEVLVIAFATPEARAAFCEWLTARPAT